MMEMKGKKNGPKRPENRGINFALKSEGCHDMRD